MRIVLCLMFYFSLGIGQGNVNVEGANDNPPVFELKSYIGMMLITSNFDDRTVMRVKATDKLVYNIAKTTGSNDVLNNINDLFTVGSSTGTIHAVFTPKADYEGHFTLEMTVQDEAPENHTDTTEVKIYLVTDKNLVNFTFVNDLDEVVAAKDNITVILDDVFQNFNYVSNVQQPQKGDPVGDTPRSVAPVYFLNTKKDTPVERSEIYKEVADLDFFRQMRSKFAYIGLTEAPFDTNSANHSFHVVGIVLFCMQLVYLF